MPSLARAAIALILSLPNNSIVGPTAYHNDAISGGQWYVNYLDLKDSHRISTGEGVLVAIVDTGVDSTHPTLQGRVLPGADFSTGTDKSTGDGRIDLDGHGTGMASLIVGHGPISGVAPEASILPVRVMDTASSGRASQIALGINWAVAHGADVVNVSITSAVRDPRELAAVQNAISKDVVIVAGAGNTPEATEVQYPARFDGVIAVAAVNRAGDHAAVSVKGAELTVSAPGEDVSMADRSGRYVLATGTSVASAIVSGLVALIRSATSSRTVVDVTDRLIKSSTDKGPAAKDDTFGYGIVNPYRALTAKIPSKTSARSVGASERVDGKPESSHSAKPWAFLLGAVTLLAMVILLLAATRVLRRRSG